MANLIYNAIKVHDGTILESRYRHDYKTYTDRRGNEFMVDGGLSYIRRGGNPKLYEEISVYDTDDFQIIREKFTWGTRGKDGKQPLTYVKLRLLDTDHIEAILRTQFQVPQYLRDIFHKELRYRGNIEEGTIIELEETSLDLGFLDVISKYVGDNK